MFPEIREMFCSFFTPKPFSEHSRFVIISCLFFFFCFSFSTIQCFFFLHQPLLRYHFCFLSFVLSLLPLSFLYWCFFSSNKFPDIPFSNPTCFNFWLFGSLIVLHIWMLFSGLVFPSLLFLLAFVWFSCGCAFRLFISGVSLLRFFFLCWFLFCFGCFCSYGARVMTKEKKGLLAVLEPFGIGLENPFGSGCSASLSRSCGGPQKQGVKQRDPGFSIKGKMRLPFADGTRASAKLAHLAATDKLRKGRRVGKNHYKDSCLGGKCLLQTSGF